jgi:transitional endoplasmic reticulum ATPase
MPNTPPLAPPTQLVIWILRLLAIGPGVRASPIHHMDSEVFQLVDVKEPDRIERSPEMMRSVFRKRLERLEPLPVDRSAPVFKNVALLGPSVDLSPLEQEILAFAVMVECVSALEGRVRAFEPLLPDTIANVVACALGEDRLAVRQALGRTGTLAKTGLLTRKEASSRTNPLALMDGLDAILMGDHADADSILSAFFRRARPAALALGDFPHLTRDIDLVTRYLERALAERKTGVNVLLYGSPGTGKTELARAVGERVGATVYEVGVEDADGDPLHADCRLGGYRLCQRFLRKSERTLVVFDEIEDVFGRSGWALFAQLRESSPDKGHRVRLLEENPVPAIWIGNGVNLIDNAILRRFDCVLELRTPPPNVRARVLRHHTADLPVRPAFVEATSHDDRITPGHIERAAKVARTIGDADPDRVEGAIARVMGNVLAAQGAPRPHRAATGPCRYDPAFVNANADLDKVAAGLAERKRGNLCLYGAPGTGKTAFIHHMADRIGTPVAMRRASDLLSMWVGATEQNISRMFREAEDQGAILLLDEADSFLQDRGRAHQSWEVTQVNELLVQMEAFEGIFACTTNLVESLDRAAFRRFEIKIRFDALKLDQRVAMLTATLAELGVALPEGADLACARRDLSGLDTLTPGDFAAVARNVAITTRGGASVSAIDVVRALSDECRVKPDQGKRVIGFS